MRRALFAFVLVVLGGCASTPPPSAPPPPDPASVMPKLEERLAILIEEERGKIDPRARPLAIDPELSTIARARASDMAAKNYLAHASPTGDTAASLLMARDATFQGLLGENMSSVKFSRAYAIDVDAYARDLVDGWLKSPKHRENMSFADYHLAGIGAAVSQDTIYVTVLFATDLGLPKAASAEAGQP